MKCFLLAKSVVISFCMLFLSYLQAGCSGQIAIIGTGYVGLTTGTGLSAVGNNVICADIDEQKIKLLQQNILPIYEPGLKVLMERNAQAGRLHFTDDVEKAIQSSQIIFIAVGTPMSDNGAADLSAAENVIHMIAHNMNGHKIICMKSTVPIGTGRRLRLVLESLGVAGDQFEMVSNPEFLREGNAVHDFLYPDRIVIGVESQLGEDIMGEVYDAFAQQNIPIVFTNLETSETIKYASNAFLATKLSYINEMNNLCEKVDADIKIVAHAMGLDNRISPSFLIPGPGFGGSCFPKDCNALLYMAGEQHVDMRVVKAALEANDQQKKIPVKKLKSLLVSQHEEKRSVLNGKTVAVWGLAFKANTDDIRYSSAINTIKLLLDEGASVKVYDPEAMGNMKQLFPSITYCDSAYSAAEGVDALILLTEWDEFRTVDLAYLGNIMRKKVVVDARGIFDPARLSVLGFVFDGIGNKVFS